jgi:hypothetical protein
MDSVILSRFCSPRGKANDTLSTSLPRACGRRLQVRPRTPWISGILDFRSFRVKFFIGLVYVLMMLLLAVCTWADSSMNHETMDSDRLATTLREGLFTKFLDSPSVTAWENLIKTLNQKGETQHAKRVAWICLIHPLFAGRRVGAMSIINTYDLSDPEEVSSLLSIDNDCLRTTFVDLAEGGYYREYAVAPQLAELLEDERYFRRNRQGRLVKILRALYHYSDTSVVSKVAKYLDDESKKVREVSARTLGKLTGHTFSRTGDMDFTPSSYYVTKAKIWWRMNKGRAEYTSAEKHLKQSYRESEPKQQTQEEMLRSQVAQLQNTDFIVWAKAFNELFEFGVEKDFVLLKTFLENASSNQVDAVYRDILIRLIEFFKGKKKTASEYQYKKNYDFRAFCY